MLTAVKDRATSLMNLSIKSIAGKICEGEMLFRRLPRTLHEIICEIILNSKVIVKSTKYTDENS